MKYKKNENENKDTINYREGFLFVDPRKKELGARILSTLKDLHLTIKKLNLKIVNSENYYIKTHSLGVPIKGVENLKEQLFGLEANLEDLKAIDFKKGCYVGQENTARMKLKNKLRRKLLPIKSKEVLKIGSEVKYNNITIGKVLINKPYPFALIKLFDPNYSEFKNENLQVDQFQISIINY
ncbi:tRNA-modifying protein YgfZ, partial [bacterium]|nr:tRNA-modifying protein YgfZ [bacterium]